MSKIKTLVLIAIAAVAAYGMPALASPITGQAVDGFGGAVIPGATDGAGWTEFYIPLNGAPVVFDGSLTRDYCSNPSGPGLGDCTGGTLEMWVWVGADWSGATELSFWFEDFDVAGLNDPNYFFEVLGLEVLDADGTLLLSLTAAEVEALVGGDHDGQHLLLNLDIDGEFYVHMTFGTEFDEELTPTARFGNTLESVMVSAVSVPEPGTLALLGTGLLVLAFSRRRRQRH